MCCKGFWKRIVSFGLSLSFGLLIVSVFPPKRSSVNTNQVKPFLKIVSSNEGSGSSGCCDTGDYYPNSQEKAAKISPLKLQCVKIISKPRADYTDEARTNYVQGKVLLRVTFLANGQIGGISVISGLPDGLTEQAINAAKGIKFEPAKQDGKPIAVTKVIEYTFATY